MISFHAILVLAEASAEDLFCLAAAVCCQLSLKSVRADISPQSWGNEAVLQYVTLYAVHLLKYAQRASLMEAQVECLSEHARQHYHFQEHDTIVLLKLNILTSNLI